MEAFHLIIGVISESGSIGSRDHTNDEMERFHVEALPRETGPPRPYRAMERLISASCLLPSRAPLRSLPRLLLHRPAASRLRPLPLPRPLLPLAAAAASQHKGLPLPSNARSFPASSVSPSENNAGIHLPSSPLAGGRDFAGPIVRKVASAFVLVLLSASIVSAVQTLSAAPAYAAVQSAAKTGGRFLRTELLSSAWTGFFTGCLHTLSGPDHLAALAPLSIGRTRLESAVVGALWGCGHDAGQVIFGLLFLLLKDRLHIEVIRTWGTRVVGLTLLVIGAMGIGEASEVPTPCVALGNGECHVSTIGHLEAAPKAKKKIGFATCATGIVHGLQPDALMMVLPALALPSRIAGAAFLGMFLVGTVLAMGSYTVFIGSCSQALKHRVPRITEKLTWAASLVAIAMGVAILVSQLFGFSLY